MATMVDSLRAVSGAYLTSALDAMRAYRATAADAEALATAATDAAFAALLTACPYEGERAELAAAHAALLATVKLELGAALAGEAGEAPAPARRNGQKRATAATPAAEQPAAAPPVGGLEGAVRRCRLIEVD